MKNRDTNLGVYAIIKKGRKFLMARREDGSIGLVGGRVKEDETLYEAMFRELYEEINLTPQKIIITPIIERFKSRRATGWEKHHFFFVELSSDENPRRGDEDFIWVNEKEMVKSIFPSREKAKKEVLKLYKEGKLFKVRS